jgi:hypothetical protein
LLQRRFVTGDVLLRRRFVEETFSYGDVLLGDVLSRRRFVRRRLYVRPRKHDQVHDKGAKNLYTLIFCNMILKLNSIKLNVISGSTLYSCQKQKICLEYLQYIKFVVGILQQPRLSRGRMLYSFFFPQCKEISVLRHSAVFL